MGSLKRMGLVAVAVALEGVERLGALLGRQDIRDWADDRWTRVARRLAAD